MKVLFVPTRTVDVLQDVLYLGLKQLGAEVLDYPYKPLYHCENREGRAVVFNESGREIGRESEDGMIEFQVTHYGQMRVHKWLALFDRRGAVTEGRGEIDLDDFDMIVVGSLKYNVSDLGPSIMRKAGGRAIFLDGEDDPYIRKVWRMSSLYLKRELVVREKLRTFAKWAPKLPRYAPYWSRNLSWDGTMKNLLIPGSRPARMASMSLSVNEHSYDDAKLDQVYDISLVAGATNPVRPRFARQLLEFSRKHQLKVRVNVHPHWLGNVRWREYVRTIRQSKICVSLPGLSYDTMRYWEIPYYGSLLAAPRLPIEIRDNFEDMISAILFESFDEFSGKALKVLRSGAWAEMKKNCHDHFVRCHTSLQRAERLLRLSSGHEH